MKPDELLSEGDAVGGNVSLKFETLPSTVGAIVDELNPVGAKVGAVPFAPVGAKVGAVSFAPVGAKVGAVPFTPVGATVKEKFAMVGGAVAFPEADGASVVLPPEGVGVLGAIVGAWVKFPLSVSLVETLKSPSIRVARTTLRQNKFSKRSLEVRKVCSTTPSSELAKSSNTSCVALPRS